MKIDQHIEIVRSNTSSLSSMGEKSCDMIREILERHYTRVGVTEVSTIADLRILVAKRPDLVFLGMKNIPLVTSAGKVTPAKIWISAYLKSHGINYTGSESIAIGLDYDKPSAKGVIHAAGLKTSSYFIARVGQFQSALVLPLAFPLFIKPPRGGGGKGIGADSVVRNFEQFEQKVQDIQDEFNTHSLVETYLPGREFSVAIIGHNYSKNLTTMPIELIADANDQGDRILGQTVKAADTERVRAVTNPVIRQAINKLAVNVFQTLGARDYGRIDIRLDDMGIPHFIEANLVPGLAEHEFTSYFTSACMINQSVDHETMILKITQLGLSRPSGPHKMIRKSLFV